jgi:hypothetical protein
MGDFLSAGLWISVMVAGPVFAIAGLFGLPLRLWQLFKGSFSRRYQTLGRFAKVATLLAGVAAVVALSGAVLAAYAMYAQAHCTAGGGCAQGGFSVAFCSGLFGLSYLALELLLLPFTITTLKTSNL